MTILTSCFVAYLVGLAGALLILFGRVSRLPDQRFATARRRQLRGDQIRGTTSHFNHATYCGRTPLQVRNRRRPPSAIRT